MSAMSRLSSQAWLEQAEPFRDDPYEDFSFLVGVGKTSGPSLFACGPVNNDGPAPPVTSTAHILSFLKLV